MIEVSLSTDDPEGITTRQEFINALRAAQIPFKERKDPDDPDGVLISVQDEYEDAVEDLLDVMGIPAEDVDSDEDDYEDEDGGYRTEACPGGKIRSKGKGRGLGVGKGKGPIGRMAEVDTMIDLVLMGLDPADVVDECKTKKGKKKPKMVGEALWVQKVKTKWSPPPGFFKQSAGKIVSGLMAASADKKQAMSRLNFYINRAGKNLSPEDRARLEKARAALSKK